MKARSEEEGSRTDENGDWRCPSVFSDPVSLVKQGKADWEWTEVTLTEPERPERLRITVMKEPIRFDIHNGAKVRGCVSAKELQEIADHIGGIFHTSKTLDAKAKAAQTIIQPLPFVGRKLLADASDRALSDAYDEVLRKMRTLLGKSDLGIVSSFGPCWILTEWMNMLQGGEDANKSFMYGGHGASGRHVALSGDRVMYPIVHPDTDGGWTAEKKAGHVFADLCRDRAVLIDADGAEESVWLSEVYQDEELVSLANYGGVLPVRQCTEAD